MLDQCLRGHDHPRSLTTLFRGMRRYRAFLKKVKEKVAAYYVPSIPRQRVVNANKSDAFAARNAVMAEWVAAAGPPFRWVPNHGRTLELSGT